MLAILNLDKRKQRILDAIVRDYLYTTEPVGSSTICENYIDEVSSATIRNEMAELEESGYIEQPHASAGRIPTDRGYRFYVDHLMRHRNVTPKEECYFKDELDNQSCDDEEMLYRTTKKLSTSLEYTTVIINSGLKHKVFSSGIANILHHPEFRKIEQAQQILDLFEEEDFLTEIIEGYSDPNNIDLKIGKENIYSEMKGCSVIVATYKFRGSQGGLSIIGPTRMFYGKALRMIKYVVNKLKEIGG